MIFIIKLLNVIGHVVAYFFHLLNIYFKNLVVFCKQQTQYAVGFCFLLFILISKELIIFNEEIVFVVIFFAFIYFVFIKIN